MLQTLGVFLPSHHLLKLFRFDLLRHWSGVKSIPVHNMFGLCIYLVGQKRRGILHILGYSVRIAHVYTRTILLSFVVIWMFCGETLQMRLRRVQRLLQNRHQPVRWKGGGGGGGGGGGRYRIYEEPWKPPPGQRLCSICGIENEIFTVKLSDGQSDTIWKCEGRGTRCNMAFEWKWGKYVMTIYALVAAYSVSEIWCWIFDHLPKTPEQAQKHVEIAMVRKCKSDTEAERNAQKDYVCGSSHDCKPFKVDANTLELLSARYDGSYVESGCNKISHYSLYFRPGEEGFVEVSGDGYDSDGKFEVNGLFNPVTRRLAWGERSSSKKWLYARCHLTCEDEACRKLEGDYLATTGLGGSLRLRNLSPVSWWEKKKKVPQPSPDLFWKKYYDEESDAPYWWNSQTGESSWLDPTISQASLETEEDSRR